MKFFITIFALSLPYSVLAATPREIAARVLPTVVAITVFDSNGLPKAEGSGFFLEGDLIVTNYHVMKGGISATAKVVGTDAVYKLVGVVSYDEIQDLVLLKTDSMQAATLELANGEPSIGDPVFVAGNPIGLEGTFSSGLISGKRNSSGVDLLQISAPISPGSSGGPVVNEQAQAVGVAVATMRLGQNLNFAIPTARVKSLERKSLQSLKAVFEKVRPDSSEPAGGSVNEFSSPDGMVTTYALVNGGSSFSLTIKNNNTSPIWKVNYLVIAYDKEGRPIDSVGETMQQKLIPPNLAKRVDGKFSAGLPLALVDKYEVRILRYQIWSEKDAFIKYTVTPGDSLAKIARKFGVTEEALLEANPGFDQAHSKIGDQLLIPRKIE